MEKKERRVSLIMAVLISAIMGVIFSYITRGHQDPKALENMPPAPAAYLINILESVIVGVIITFVIPMGKMGRALTRSFGVKPPSFKFTLVNCIPFALINAILVSAICSFIGVATSYGKIMDPNKPPLMAMWSGNWLKLLPVSIVVSYVFSIIISPFVVKAVGLGGPPEGRAGGPPEGRAGGPPEGRA